MNYNYISDKFVSNLIVFLSYSLVSFLWYYLYYNYLNEAALLLYFPYGIIILSFLFFDNKIIFSLLLNHIIFDFIFLKYNLGSPFHNYFWISFLTVISVPITLLALKKFDIKVGVGENYKLNKTNIYHVLLIAFISTIFLGTFIILYSIFFENQFLFLQFVIGNFLGGCMLILGIKLVVNLPDLIKSIFKNN